MENKRSWTEAAWRRKTSPEKDSEYSQKAVVAAASGEVKKCRLTSGTRWWRHVYSGQHWEWRRCAAAEILWTFDVKSLKNRLSQENRRKKLTCQIKADSGMGLKKDKRRKSRVTESQRNPKSTLQIKQSSNWPGFLSNTGIKEEGLMV